MMFDRLPKSKFDIVSADGQVRGQTDAIATGKEIIVPDERVIIQPGDEMRRRLPNGTDETFEVIDPVFMEKTFGIPSHFQVKVRKKGLFPHGTGGNYHISVSGPNSRVNINSVDRSSNAISNAPVFGDLISAIETGIARDEERAPLIAAVRSMDSEKGTSGFISAYQKFIGLAADHMGVVGPFLPALSSYLGG